MCRSTNLDDFDWGQSSILQKEPIALELDREQIAGLQLLAEEHGHYDIVTEAVLAIKKYLRHELYSTF